MAKNKRQKLDNKRSKVSHSSGKHAASRTGKAISKPTAHKHKSKPQIQHQHKPSVPFIHSDKILLVGEGDFSFAHSLVQHHGDKYKSLCATCFDSREQLHEKYPQAELYISEILSSQNRVSSPARQNVTAADSQDHNEPPMVDIENSDSTLENGIPPSDLKKIQPRPSTVLCGVDATALSQQKLIRNQKWDRIVFNFPHVGGKSTDVNRQVRYNQALLHAFFQAAKPLLLPPRGTILVTLFEGAPYDLWNIRDLIRSAGLRVIRSFAFDSSLYPGYAHARTTGNIRGRERTKGHTEGRPEHNTEMNQANVLEDPGSQQIVEVSDNVRPGKWRGEERKARTYECGFTSEDMRKIGGDKRKRKRKGQGEESSDDER